MSENNAIQQSVSIDAPRGEVFKALTDAGTLRRWFPSEAQTDLRPGGKYRFVFQNRDPKNGGTQEGEFLEVQPDERVSYTWEAAGQPTRVEFSLSGSGGQTQVDLAHTGFGEGEAGSQVRELHAGVWGIYLSNLKSYLEEGRDERAEKLGQIVG